MSGLPLPVTAASPVHACGGRGAAEESDLAAFSHVASQLSQRSLSQASTRPSPAAAAVRPVLTSAALGMPKKSCSQYRADPCNLPLVN